MRLVVRAVLFIFPGILLSTAAPSLSGDGGATGDAQKGKTVFARCAACHSMDAGKNGIGPTLAGVVGRQAGSVNGFRYSAALKGSGIRWDAASLDNYLASPRKAVPGTTMMVGVPNTQQRADVIAYLCDHAK